MRYAKPENPCEKIAMTVVKNLLISRVQTHTFDPILVKIDIAIRAAEYAFGLPGSTRQDTFDPLANAIPRGFPAREANVLSVTAGVLRCGDEIKSSRRLSDRKK
jgi:hypothetical protein